MYRYRLGAKVINTAMQGSLIFIKFRLCDILVDKYLPVYWLSFVFIYLDFVTPLSRNLHLFTTFYFEQRCGQLCQVFTRRWRLACVRRMRVQTPSSGWPCLMQRCHTQVGCFIKVLTCPPTHYSFYVLNPLVSNILDPLSLGKLQSITEVQLRNQWSPDHEWFTTKL